ncbi:MAG: cupin domain-containing protein [Microbacteriaceae bacterium]
MDTIASGASALEKAGEHSFGYELHGGAPMRMQWHFYGRSELPVAVQTWELPPGGFEGMHAHTEDDLPLEEIYVVIAGTGQLQVDGITHAVAAGDAVLAPVGSEHDLRNTGDIPLKVLVVWGKPGTADYTGFASAALAKAAHAAGAAGAC